MSNIRKRRVTLVTGEDVVPLPLGTGGNVEEKLMTRASKKKKMALTANTMAEESTDVMKQAETQKSVIGGGQTGTKQSAKVKRQSWTSTGIEIFFEALAEHGKDFGKILNYMCAKEKKRKQRDPFIERLTKNQVRFYYYRTWHKVSSLLALGEREEDSPNGGCNNSHQKRLPKTQVHVPSCEVVKVCNGGGSDDETEEETEAVFDMSLDEGDDSQDGCTDQLRTASVATLEDGDSLPSGNSHFGNPSSFKSDITEPYCDHPPSDREGVCAINEESDNCLVNSVPGDNVARGNSDGGNIGVISDGGNIGVISDGDVVMTGGETSAGVTGVISDVVEIGKHDKKKNEAGGGGGSMVKVNGVLQSLDLVAIICYRKMSQQWRGDKEVLGRKLKELIYNGTTNIRIKGRRRKEMKIPNCPALRSLKGAITSDTGTIECSNVCDNPSTLTFELQPLNSATWSYVQQLSMNPRLRLSLTPSRTIKELYNLIATKWHISPKNVFNILKLFKRQQRLTNNNSESHDSESHDSKSHDSITTTKILPLGQPVNVYPLEKDNTSLQPLELDPFMSLGELTTKLFGKTKRSKVSLHYQIINQKTDITERNFDHLMKLATFLTTSYMPPLTPSAAPSLPTLSSPVTPPSLLATPTDRMSSTATPTSLISSPVVLQYMKNLPKKSPMKSPLAKYKRLRPSPLKARQSMTSSLNHRIKPIQLQYPVIPNKSPSTLPYKESPSTLPYKESSSTLPYKEKPLHSTTSKSRAHSCKDKNKKTPHLVTISKKCLSQSGSFTGLRLDDIFQSVNDNFKGVQSKNNKSKTQNISNVSVVPLPENTAIITSSINNEGLERTTVTEVISPSVTMATPSVTTTTHDHSSSLPIKASPLERLASEVSSSTHLLQHSATTSNYQINITTTGVSTTRPPLTIASPTGRPISSIATKPIKRNPNSQRPVVPKPLIYLPQFSKQLASLQVPHPQSIQNTLQSLPPTTQTSAAIHPLHQTNPPVQTALNTQDLLQAQVSLLQELLSKPTSQNREDEQKRQQAVQTLLQSLITLGAQYPALLQKLDLKSLLSAAVQSKSSGNKPAQSTTSKELLPANITSNPLPDQIITSSDSGSSLSSFPIFNSPIKSFNYSEPLHSSSDTVSELLKGLSSNDDQLLDKESVIQLSQDTVDVLPSFARAMMHFSNTDIDNNPIDQNNRHSLKSIKHKDSSSSSTDILTLLQTGDNSEYNPIDRTIVDNTDYSDVFAQLQDILSTPERPSVSNTIHHVSSNSRCGELGASSNQNKSPGEILDIFNSPFKTHQTLSTEHSLRSMMEENSVDYINKFKELASSMNNTS